MPGQRLLRGQRPTGVTDERGAEVLCAIHRSRARVDIVSAAQNGTHHCTRNGASCNVVPERLRVEFASVALQHLLALNSRVQPGRDAGVDRRAHQGPGDDLGDDAGYCLFGHFGDRGADDLADRRFGHRDGRRGFDRRTPVDPCRCNERGQRCSQRNEIRDEHFLRELDLRGHVVDGFGQLAQLSGDGVDGS
ncbi:hypothetical protein [Mycobacterium sp. 1423905.2]|uniref:hypothetical protein n=1 Tax=Mycobacterium sp. 1423905.2 TaxID=1856859 RepID=UPI0020A5FEE4|nr:hypothetical protein [Mycobacterium sp. 1423905.2]